MSDNNKIKYILLGLGIGIIVTNVLYYINPRIEYEDLSDDDIVARAEELGMVTLKEQIKINEEKIREEEEKKKEEEEIEKTGLKEKTLEEQIGKKEELEKEDDKKIKDKATESEVIVFKVDKGDSLYDISEKLYELGLIDDEKKFDNRVYEREVSKRMRYGEYDIEAGSDYDTIIDLLIKK